MGWYKSSYNGGKGSNGGNGRTRHSKVQLKK